MPEGEASWVDVLARVARAWRDPDHPARAEAVERTLAAPNRFTEEAVAFAVNQRMHALTHEAVAGWMKPATGPPRTVGVLHAGSEPLEGLEALLAVVLAGHRYRGVVAAASPGLLPAFVAEVRAAAPELPARFVPDDVLWDEAEALIAYGDESRQEQVRAACRLHGLPSGRCLCVPSGFAVAVLDGQETAAERERLAEDVLLYEGLSPRNVALVWAPRDLSPDPYLEAFALFRSVFPPHPGTPGALQMQKALLEAFGVPHAYGEGPSFLVSKGAPEVQSPGHLRWSEYDRLDDVRRWVAAHRAVLTGVVARPAVRRALPPDLPVVPPGEMHRPALDDLGAAIRSFLATL
ncbi:MAG: hypothetical protein KatS3mg043_0917 [Rhodothermaceae bacterium]|nr:MAG: hypothetical protein KatS3mg043_0917 [Rhodothermaceae bacterium]